MPNSSKRSLIVSVAFLAASAPRPALAQEVLLRPEPTHSAD